MEISDANIVHFKIAHDEIEHVRERSACLIDGHVCPGLLGLSNGDPIVFAKLITKLLFEKLNCLFVKVINLKFQGAIAPNNALTVLMSPS